MKQQQKLSMENTASGEASALAFLMQMVYGPPQILSRASYTEDFLRDYIKQGLKQYIILGAGMDTFAFRCPEMLERLQLFELDHPATQSFKLRRLKELKWEIPSQMHFIPVDLTRESLASALKNISYDSVISTLKILLTLLVQRWNKILENTLKSIDPEKRTRFRS